MRRKIMKIMKIIAIDFDGTLVKSKYPNIRKTKY